MVLAAQFDLWRIRNQRMRLALHCFPPCLIHSVDGIFRPGGGRLWGEDVRQSLPD